MGKKQKEPSNSKIEQLVPSTAAEFYTSSRMGWAELDDEAIDSSITAGLLMNQLIVFERQHIDGVYHWTIYVDALREDPRNEEARQLGRGRGQPLRPSQGQGNEDQEAREEEEGRGRRGS